MPFLRVDSLLQISQIKSRVRFKVTFLHTDVGKERNLSSKVTFQNVYIGFGECFYF